MCAKQILCALREMSSLFLPEQMDSLRLTRQVSSNVPPCISYLETNKTFQQALLTSKSGPPLIAMKSERGHSFGNERLVEGIVFRPTT